MTEETSARMPNVARIYDFLLGGKENCDEDRRAAQQLLVNVPDAAVAAWDNREFLGRAVRFLAEEAGIRQFIDIGTGLPTRGNVHAVAQQFAPGARVVYVDYDPDVIRHAQKLLRQHSNVVAIEGDLRNPGQLLANSALRALISFDEPIAVILVAVLHFIRDDESPYDIVSYLKHAMPPKSHLVLSHVTSDDIAPETARRVEKLYERTTAPGVTRTRAEIARFFDGLDLIPPGLVNVASWRSDWMTAEPGRTIFYAGVGSK
jgi:O-methyltransferase involved in polyketide biosynthesis